LHNTHYFRGLESNKSASFPLPRHEKNKAVGHQRGHSSSNGRSQSEGGRDVIAKSLERLVIVNPDLFQQIQSTAESMLKSKQSALIEEKTIQHHS